MKNTLLPLLLLLNCTLAFTQQIVTNNSSYNVRVQCSGSILDWIIPSHGQKRIEGPDCSLGKLRLSFPKYSDMRFNLIIKNSTSGKTSQQFQDGSALFPLTRGELMIGAERYKISWNIRVEGRRRRHINVYATKTETRIVD